MKRYFTDIYESVSSILGGMSITLVHLLKLEMIMLLFNILKKSGQGQKETLDLTITATMLLGQDYMLIWMIVLGV